MRRVRSPIAEAQMRLITFYAGRTRGAAGLFAARSCDGALGTSLNRSARLAATVRVAYSETSCS